jgi:hypothetical protein
MELDRQQFYQSRSGAVRCAIRDTAAKPDDMTQRGWSSFADTRHSTFSKTIGEDQRIRLFLAAVCRRRWPSCRRRQAPQRPTYLRISATVIFRRQGGCRSGDVAKAVASVPKNNTVGGLCSCLGSEKESCVANQPLTNTKSPL